jgi:hypothetical protein
MCVFHIIEFFMICSYGIMLLFCVFGCRLRLQAESKGFRLDDTGLFPATQGSGGKRV